MVAEHRYFATVPLGLEEALAGELTAVGAAGAAVRRAGVAFEGPLEVGYRACLWCRTGSRVLLELGAFAAGDAEALYAGAREVAWEEHLGADRTFAVQATSVRSELAHTGFVALKVKDAVADRFRERTGRRPSVDTVRPDVRIAVHVEGDQATVSLDLSGESLHKREWRQAAGLAPMKENLAAGVLLLAGWPEAAGRGGGLVDPMCGSGTLPVEGALMALDVAPGLMRSRFGFERWRGHDAGLWARLVAEARARDLRRRPRIGAIAGFDADVRVLEAARRNAAAAGVGRLVRLEVRELSLVEPAGDVPGLVVVNPPYGERLGEMRELSGLYRRLGATLKLRFAEWTAYVLAGNAEVARQVGLRVERRMVLFNGPIECRLLKIPILPPKPSPAAAAVPCPSPGGATLGSEGREPWKGDGPGAVGDGRWTMGDGRTCPSPGGATLGSEGREPWRPCDAAGEMFANRLRKNLAHVRRWAEREGVTCYRVYDGDLPEFALTVDRYEGWVVVRESERPKEVEALVAEARLHAAMRGVCEVLGVVPGDVFLKERRRQREGRQYGKLAEGGAEREVHEAGHTYLVNLSDYFDTGLYLDQRLTRGLIAELSAGRDFLNLFSYTGTASVAAAGGGARTTTAVDLSHTYLEWARRNLVRNGFGGREHRLVEADVLSWIKAERRKYGLIFLDPPTFSNSKGMKGTFDLERDHVWLLRAVSRLLARDGLLLFTSHGRRFGLDAGALPELEVEEVTRQTIPPDFVRSPRVHSAWRIRVRASGSLTGGCGLG